MLKVDRVSKSYSTPRGDLPILDGVSLELARGQAAAIMGPSGSGKSTLLYILGALDRPTSGTVTLAGENPFTLPAGELAAFRNRQFAIVLSAVIFLGAGMVLACADGLSNAAVAQRFSVSVPTASKWRSRFATQRLAGLEDEDGHEWDRHSRDERSEDRDGGGAPEPDERRVLPERRLERGAHARTLPGASSAPRVVRSPAASGLRYTAVASVRQNPRTTRPDRRRAPWSAARGLPQGDELAILENTLRIHGARTFSQFRRAVTGLGALDVNWVFSSRDGHIGYQLGTLTFVRPRNLARFAVFVACFPQLVAGPIVRASELLPQLEQCFAPEDLQLRTLVLTTMGGNAGAALAIHAAEPGTRPSTVGIPVEMRGGFGYGSAGSGSSSQARSNGASAAACKLCPTANPASVSRMRTTSIIPSSCSALSTRRRSVRRTPSAATSSSRRIASPSR